MNRKTKLLILIYTVLYLSDVLLTLHAFYYAPFSKYVEEINPVVRPLVNSTPTKFVLFTLLILCITIILSILISRKNERYVQAVLLLGILMRCIVIINNIITDITLMRVAVFQ